MSKNYINDPILTNWELVSVNPKDKNWTWMTVFNIWANSIQSLIGFSLIATLFLVYGLNGWVIFLGTILGGIFTIFIANLSGKPCQKMGIPFVVFLRLSMGVYGARFVGLLRGIVGIFMFGTQTFFISKSLGFLIRIALFSFDGNLINKEIFNLLYLDLGIIDWSALMITALIQYYLFTRSINLIKKIINFSGILIYLAMISFTLLIFSKLQTELINSFFSIFRFDETIALKNIFPLISVFGTMFVYFSIILINFGDYSRYVKNESELKKGNYSLIINIILFSFMAVFITLGVDIIFNKQLVKLDRILTNPTDIVRQIDQIYLTILVLIFVIISSAGTNLIVNYIPSSYSLINFIPNKISIKSCGFTISILGFAIGGLWVSIISKIGLLSIIDTIGAFFGPLFGIMIVDYYLIKKQSYNPKDLFSSDPNGRYFYSKGWNLKALYALFIAFVFSAVTIWNQDFTHLQSYAWFIGAFMGGLMYFLLSKK